jgi:hypothetical protein
MYTSQTTSHKHHLISHLKQRLSPHRYEYTNGNENNSEKNQGFLLIDQIDADLVLIPNDHIDQQGTRHAEPCEHVQIDDAIIDIAHIQLESTTPVTPHLLPPPPQSPLPSSILPVTNRT